MGPLADAGVGNAGDARAGTQESNLRHMLVLLSMSIINAPREHLAQTGEGLGCRPHTQRHLGKRRLRFITFYWR